MSTGPIFTLHCNDGKQDAMIYASNLLNSRLDEITKLKQRQGNPDPTPSLADIEKTHILFQNAHYKPHVATTHDFDISQPQHGNPAFGNSVTFNIPTYGDFFSDMAIHVRISEGVSKGDKFENRWQYADYLGERLFEKVSFVVNNNPINEYGPEIAKLHESFFVTPNKRLGWERLIGQEESYEGYITLGSAQSCNSSSVNTPKNSCGDAAISHIDSSVSDKENDPSGCSGDAVMRQKVEFTCGLQTPKRIHSGFELWIPLLFWFNLDTRLAIPSISIPFGQRYIIVNIAELNNVARTSYDPVLGDLATTNAGSAVNFKKVPTIEEINLYTNFLFVCPEIHDIYVQRIGFNLIRLYQTQITQISKPSDRISLSTFKYPIETIFAGIRPMENCTTVSITPNLTMENWHVFSATDSSRRLKMPTYNPTPPNTLVIDTKNATVQVKKNTTGWKIKSYDYKSSKYCEISGINKKSLVAKSDNNKKVYNAQLDISINDYLVKFLFANPSNDYESPDSDKKGDIVDINPSDLNVSGLIATLISELYQIFTEKGIDGDVYPKENCTYAKFKPRYNMITNLGFESHGVKIKKNLPELLWNSYVPYMCGGNYINVPKDRGLMMMTFGLYPGSYQPSGHFNFSRSRENFLVYESGKVPPMNPQSGIGDLAIGPIANIPLRKVGDPWIDGNHPASLILVGIAINFLLISDGSAILRFAT
jgi:hypothetical protein